MIKPILKLAFYIGLIVAGFKLWPILFETRETTIITLVLGGFFGMVAIICYQDWHDSQYKTYGYRNKKQPWNPED